MPFTDPRDMKRTVQEYNGMQENRMRMEIVLSQRASQSPGRSGRAGGAERATPRPTPTPTPTPAGQGGAAAAPTAVGVVKPQHSDPRFIAEQLLPPPVNNSGNLVQMVETPAERERRFVREARMLREQEARNAGAAPGAAPGPAAGGQIRPQAQGTGQSYAQVAGQMPVIQESGMDWALDSGDYHDEYDGPDDDYYDPPGPGYIP